MNRMESLELLTEMQQRWPQKKLEAQTVAFYRSGLEPLDCKGAKAAVVRLFEKRGTFPTIAHIRQEMGMVVEKPKPAAAESATVSARGHAIAGLLSDVSNVTLPKKLRHDLAESLAWELGVVANTEYAWHFATECRFALGWSKDSRLAWQQIASHFRPDGRVVTHHDWLRVAGFTADDGTENLPDAKLSAHGVRGRIATEVDKFCRARGAPVPTRQETANPNRPDADPDPDGDRWRGYPPWIRREREALKPRETDTDEYERRYP